MTGILIIVVIRLCQGACTVIDYRRDLQGSISRYVLPMTWLRLNDTNDMSMFACIARFDLMKHVGTYYIVCIETEGIIVACATLIVEHKFLHECGQV